jgi:predicted P-loop ATPase
MVAERLDDDEKNTVSLTDGNRGNPNITIISEARLYRVILRSDKPEADKLMRFITHEVLPQIRKTGSYIKTPRTYIQALEALIETEREKERLALENSDLQIELDESKKYYTIKRVAKINGVSWRLFNWKRLKDTSHAMECEIKKVFDANFEEVNAYYIDVWKHEYPELRYGK